jgi:hypothetical protein
MPNHEKLLEKMSQKWSVLSVRDQGMGEEMIDRRRNAIVDDNTFLCGRFEALGSTLTPSSAKRCASKRSRCAFKSSAK